MRQVLFNLLSNGVKFTEAEAHTSRKSGGTGLRLALSREICRMTGGEITVESVPGVGSAFTVTLQHLVDADPESVVSALVEARRRA